MVSDEQLVLLKTIVRDGEEALVPVHGIEKIRARELEKLGLIRFVDYYHGDQFWLPTNAGTKYVKGLVDGDR